MRRTWLLLLSAAALAGLGAWLAAGRPRSGATRPSPPDTPSRPSVVLISLDTLRADHLGCYGHARPTSPNLDRFARDCVRFAACRSQAPWTLPSHMALFT